MVSANSLANTLLKKSFEENINITPMKLQKLIYFIYKRHLKNFNEKLFEEAFLVWRYGPVLASVYDEFKSFGSERITRFAKDANQNVYVINESATDIMESINEIWESYKNYDGVSLSIMTHQPGTAWSKAVNSHLNILCDEDIKNED